MSENTETKKKRNPRPTNLVRATVYETTDKKIWQDRRLAGAHQKKLDLMQCFTENPIAEGVTVEDLYDYIKQYKPQFHAVLRTIGKDEE